MVALITKHDKACIFSTGMNFAKLANLASVAKIGNFAKGVHFR